MANKGRQSRQLLLALALLLPLLAFCAGRAPTASAFSYDYCVNWTLYPGGTCNDSPFLLRTWNRGWSTQSGAYPCVYFLTANNNKRGSGSVDCNSGSVSMRLSNPSPYVVNGANSGGAKVSQATPTTLQTTRVGLSGSAGSSTTLRKDE